MYLAIDVGGTKTLLALFDSEGQIQNSVKFATPKDYSQFLQDLKKNIDDLGDSFSHICVGVPGKIDRKNGVALAFGNLPGTNLPIKDDLEKLFKLPVLIENDANLAGLSEARLVMNQYSKALYVTISTGIGTGIIVDGVMDPSFIDSEGGHIMLDHNGKVQKWEHFASGKAIVEKYGKKASEIEDPSIWKQIAKNIAIGLIDLIAVIQPQVIILGGGVGAHLEKYQEFLENELKKFETPLTPIPPIIKAGRPEEAVVYGCYDLIKQIYG